MPDSKPSLSIIVPAYLEAKNLRGTIQAIILAASEANFTDYEILIIDCLKQNGEHDGTPLLADELAKTDPKIRAIHNPYVTLGYKYWQGVSLAKHEYVTWIPGDNETRPDTIKAVFSAVGQADIICFYTANPWARPWTRRINSWLYTFLVNNLFGLRLRYFNGITIYKTELLSALPDSAKKNIGFSYNAEILARLIKLGRHQYLELPQFINQQPPKKFRWSNFKNFFHRYAPLQTIKKLLKLFWELKTQR